MLSDSEICVSLGINSETLHQYYNTVERSRVLLKQKLNARKITDAATGTAGIAQQIIEAIPRSRRGGVRPGSGRKPGTTNKISGATILASVEHYTGERFEDLLAQGYAEAIDNRDTMVRLAYEKMFLGKVVADRVEMDINEGAASIEAKRLVFCESIRHLIETNQKAK